MRVCVNESHCVANLRSIRIYLNLKRLPPKWILIPVQWLFRHPVLSIGHFVLKTFFLKIWDIFVYPPLFWWLLLKAVQNTVQRDYCCVLTGYGLRLHWYLTNDKTFEEPQAWHCLSSLRKLKRSETTYVICTGNIYPGLLFITVSSQGWLLYYSSYSRRFHLPQFPFFLFVLKVECSSSGYQRGVPVIQWKSIYFNGAERTRSGSRENYTCTFEVAVE